MKNEFNIEVRLSEEAKFVENYLKENNIKYIPEFPLVDLYSSKDIDNISPTYRKTDFYLPKLKIHIEYFGMYNVSKEKRKACEDKSKQLIANHIPTIFIYPRHLGYLDYYFNNRIQKLLSLTKFNFGFKKYRYRLNRYYQKERGRSIFNLFISLYIYFILTSYLTGLSDQFLTFILLLLIVLILMFSFKTIKQLYKYLIRGN